MEGMYAAGLIWSKENWKKREALEKKHIKVCNISSSSFE